MKKVRLITSVFTILNAVLALWMFRLPLGFAVSLLLLFIGFGLRKVTALLVDKKYQESKMFIISGLIFQSVFLLFILMNLLAFILIG